MRLAIFSILATLLVGCAPRHAATRPYAITELDTDKMSQVERRAQAHNTKVIWVNPPVAHAK
jgi:hypothetical protein